jgi:hypothetical protein
MRQRAIGRGPLFKRLAKLPECFYHQPRTSALTHLSSNIQEWRGHTYKRTAAGTGFQSFQVDWAPGLDAASGRQTTGVTLTGAGSAPVTNGSLAVWDTSSINTAGYYPIRLTVTISNSPRSSSHHGVPRAGSALSQLAPVSQPRPGSRSGSGSCEERGWNLSAGPRNSGGTRRRHWGILDFSLNAPGQRTVQTSHGRFLHPAVADFTGGAGDEATVIDFNPSPAASDLELCLAQRVGTVRPVCSLAIPSLLVTLMETAKRKSSPWKTSLLPPFRWPCSLATAHF